jgi:type IV pilus assembly protein PilC
MSSFSYVAVDPAGVEARGQLEVSDQSEALRRIKDMGLFPTRVSATTRKPVGRGKGGRATGGAVRGIGRIPGFRQKVKAKVLTTFTRQLATLVEAGMPLLRGLRLLEEQAESPVMKRAIGDLALAIENGSSFTEAAQAQPRIFNPLYVNMVKAGEVGGALDITLTRLAEFMEKAQRIKGKVKAALFYPCSVLVVAAGILTLLMVYVIPKFKLVFDGLLGGARMPAFTLFVFKLSEVVTHHVVVVAAVLSALVFLLVLSLRTIAGRWLFDKFKLLVPILGPVFRKAAIGRFARTLGTLVANGVPILQALTIVKETVGNVVVGRVVSSVHDNVKQGDPIAPTLKASWVFPVMIAGMVDVGEQTGAMPEMLMKIADNCDEEVDMAATAMTSLLEPIMIVLLAILVGSIVIAMFLPILGLINTDFGSQAPGDT